MRSLIHLVDETLVDLSLGIIPFLSWAIFEFHILQNVFQTESIYFPTNAWSDDIIVLDPSIRADLWIDK